MSEWLFSSSEIEYTPSRLNMTKDEEIRAKRGIINLIQEFGIFNMRFPYFTIHAAITMIYRFYMRCSLKTYSTEDIGISALFLAAKIEETPKKLKELALEFVRYEKNKQGLTLDTLTNDSREVISKIDRILLYERILLQILCFDLSFPIPQSLLVDLLTKLRADKSVFHISRLLINDSYLLPLCIQYNPEHIAFACIVIAMRILNIELQSELMNMFLSFQDYKDTVIDISSQILDLYLLSTSIPTISMI